MDFLREGKHEEKQISVTEPGIQTGQEEIKGMTSSVLIWNSVNIRLHLTLNENSDPIDNMCIIVSSNKISKLSVELYLMRN